jgi:hypothetical protein
VPASRVHARRARRAPGPPNLPRSAHRPVELDGVSTLEVLDCAEEFRLEVR